MGRTPKLIEPAGEGDRGGAPKRPPRRRLTQAERTMISDRQMLDAAIRLIAERGYQKATLAAIGEAAGYSRGLVGQRFGSKAGLLTVLVDRMADEWATGRLEPAVQGTAGIGSLRRMLEVYFATLKESTTLTRGIFLLTIEALGGEQIVADMLGKLHARWRMLVSGWIAEGLKSGEVREDVDPNVHAVLFLGVMRGVTLQYLLEPDKIDLDAVTRVLQRNLDRDLLKSPADRSGI